MLIISACWCRLVCQIQSNSCPLKCYVGAMSAGVHVGKSLRGSGQTKNFIKGFTAATNFTHHQVPPPIPHPPPPAICQILPTVFTIRAVSFERKGRIFKSQCCVLSGHRQRPQHPRAITSCASCNTWRAWHSKGTQPAKNSRVVVCCRKWWWSTLPMPMHQHRQWTPTPRHP